MKFTQLVQFYSVNDDGTITVGVKKDNGYFDYFRCRARYSIMKQLDGTEKGTLLVCEFGLVYVRGSGLLLQLVEVVEDVVNS